MDREGIPALSTHPTALCGLSRVKVMWADHRRAGTREAPDCARVGEREGTWPLVQLQTCASQAHNDKSVSQAAAQEGGLIGIPMQ
jgi:hypothetical protein